MRRRILSVLNVLMRLRAKKFTCMIMKSTNHYVSGRGIQRMAVSEITPVLNFVSHFTVIVMSVIALLNPILISGILFIPTLRLRLAASRSTIAVSSL